MEYRAQHPHWRTFSNVFKWLHCGSTSCSKSLKRLRNFSYCEIKGLAGSSTSWCKCLISLTYSTSMTYTVRLMQWMKSSWWWAGRCRGNLVQLGGEVVNGLELNLLGVNGLMLNQFDREGLMLNQVGQMV